MSTEENKALVRRYIEVVWNQRNLAALDELLEPNCQRYVSVCSCPLPPFGHNLSPQHHHARTEWREIGQPTRRKKLLKR